MKVAVQCILVLALSAAGPGALAQTESFDLVTFSTPAGERSTQADFVSFSESTSATFCQMAVYRGVSGSGDPGRDFNAEWEALVAKRYRVLEPVNTETADWPDGWRLTLGATPVHTDGAKQFISMLAVFTGHGVKVSVLVNLNDPAYQPKVDRFLQSIRLRAPAAPAQPAASTTSAPAVGHGRPPTLTSQTWYRSIAQYSNWGYNPTAAEIAKIGNQGYARWTYVFNPDGTYSFVGEFWSMNRHLEYWFHEETGMYRTSGDTVTVTPRSARRVLRNKAGQQQGAAVPVEPEPATYRYQFHYFSGIGEWNLILSPTTGQQTRRDGVFSSNSNFPSSYLYSTPPASR